MHSASPAAAGIGRKTARDAAGVAFTASADFFKRDFAEKPASNFGADWRQSVARRRPHRGSGHPLATGDGHC